MYSTKLQVLWMCSCHTILCVCLIPSPLASHCHMSLVSDYGNTVGFENMNGHLGFDIVVLWQVSTIPFFTGEYL